MHPYAWPTESMAFALVTGALARVLLVVPRHPMRAGASRALPSRRWPHRRLRDAARDARAQPPAHAHFLQNANRRRVVAPALLVPSPPRCSAGACTLPMIPALVALARHVLACDAPGCLRLRAPAPRLRPARRAPDLPRRRHSALVACGPWRVLSLGTEGRAPFGAFVLASPLGLLLALLPDPEPTLRRTSRPGQAGARAADRAG